MPIQTDRCSPVSAEINERLGHGISAAELQQLKDMASHGEVQLVDVRLTEADLDHSAVTPRQRTQIKNALAAMREILTAGPQGQDQGDTMEWIATLDPFSRAAADLSVA